MGACDMIVLFPERKKGRSSAGAGQCGQCRRCTAGQWRGGQLKGRVHGRVGSSAGRGPVQGRSTAGCRVQGRRQVRGREEMQGQVQNAKLGSSNIPPCCSQMTFHTLGWQDKVETFSRVNPRVVAARVRHTFRQRDSRPDQSHIDRWPLLPSIAAASDTLTGWRRHCLTAGLQPGSSFDEDFHQSVMTGLSDLLEFPSAAGACDAPFTFSELQQALSLSRCTESAVGPDGLPNALFKGAFSWWQAALVRPFNLILQPDNSGSSALLCPFSNMATPRCKTIYRPVSLALCRFKMLEHLVHGWIAVHISNQLHPSQGGFRWGADTTDMVFHPHECRLRRHQEGV